MAEKLYRPIRPPYTIMRKEDKECEIPKALYDEVCPEVEKFLMYLDSKGLAIHTTYDNRHYHIEMDFASRRLDK